VHPLCSRLPVTDNATPPSHPFRQRSVLVFSQVGAEAEADLCPQYLRLKDRALRAFQYLERSSLRRFYACSAAPRRVRLMSQRRSLPHLHLDVPVDAIYLAAFFIRDGVDNFSWRWRSIYAPNSFVELAMDR
jgi:hypothetical protein